MDHEDRVDQHVDLETELYAPVKTHIEDFLRKTWTAFDETSDEAHVRFSLRQRQTYRDAVNHIEHLFRYLESRIVPGQEESETQAPSSRPRLLQLWIRCFTTDFKPRLEKAISALLRAQRDYTKIRRLSSTNQPLKCPGKTDDDRISIIRDLIESLISRDEDEDSSKPSSELYRSFQSGLLAAVEDYYSSEVLQLRADLKVCKVDYTHWYLNRLSVEKEFFPEDADAETFQKPWIKAFHKAYFKKELVIFYHDIGGQYSNGQEEALSAAAANKSYDDMIRHFTHEKRDLSQQASLGRTALHAAVLANNNTLVKSILKQGAYADVEDDNKQTAGHLAVLTRNLDALNQLFTQPTAFAVQDMNNRTISKLMEDTGVKALGSDWEEALRIATSLEQTAWLFDKPLDDKDIEGDFKPTIFGFESGVYKAPEKRHGLADILKDDDIYREQMESDADFLWLHLPANNVSKLITM